jgi:hypothetical protein
MLRKQYRYVSDQLQGLSQCYQAPRKRHGYVGRCTYEHRTKHHACKATPGQQAVKKPPNSSTCTWSMHVHGGRTSMHAGPTRPGKAQTDNREPNPPGRCMRRQQRQPHARRPDTACAFCARAGKGQATDRNTTQPDTQQRSPRAGGWRKAKHKHMI